MPPAIRARRVGKQFMLGERQRYFTVRETLSRWIGGGAFRGNSRMAAANQLRALSDVSFEVQPGEVVGIIGHNGAGKSTLLKILSRITEPTEGEVELFGRVSSLLEVGTGFHPELTGRENVYLNGSILGMKRKEIDARFDEIVAFSGVERFLDTPVKRYSSGMSVRLAFAVAAHLEPEILLIDEVLAVGDAEFQRKCLGKIGDVARGGRTVLLVSHNMAAVENLCERAILLDHGRLVYAGNVEEAIKRYLTVDGDAIGDVDSRHHAHRIEGFKPIIERLRLLNGQGQVSARIGMGDELAFAILLRLAEPTAGVAIGIHIYNWRGQRVTSAHSAYQSSLTLPMSGLVEVECRLPRLDLMPGSYRVVLGLAGQGSMLDRIDPAAKFEIMPRDVFGTGRVPHAQDGVFFSRAEWSVAEPAALGDRPAAAVGMR